MQQGNKPGGDGIIRKLLQGNNRNRAELADTLFPAYSHIPRYLGEVK